MPLNKETETIIEIINRLSFFWRKAVYVNKSIFILMMLDQ